ncbi:type I polyketide synthase [Catenulispora rubra]|uniref:type I polyketide synthase n=1 Tax=Catenulispora rubra TaxID=280293 RepID=UPI0018920B22|nr:type I polyketide synthase [Catenulispora rubra]
MVELLTMNPADDAIAVVGLGCRFPGGVRSLDDFGAALTAGTGVFRDVPATRWDSGLDGSRGGFLDEIDRFDASYFGIAPREAGAMDPQQRLMLEVAWEAMSDSGRPADAWRGTRTAAFFGVFSHDYLTLHTKTLGLGGVGPHYGSGNEFSFVAGRLAYTFDLRGPMASLTTACSSSLLAVHLAGQSLRSGESDVALAGGVSLMLTPELTAFMNQIGAISPTGRCRPFAADADGILRGDGCGVLVLKRLSDALADHDRVYAVLRASAANHDGRSLGITAPNGAAQAELLRTALGAAGIGPSDLDYVEAHGTGTPLGDQVELMALDEVYGRPRDADRPALYVGSNKAVFGHTDAAAGIAGLLKGLYVINTRQVPAQPDPGRLTSAVAWDRGRMAVPIQAVSLEALDRPVRIAVSSSGLSGTNVHVIAEGFAVPEVEPVGARPAGPYVLLASAFHEAGMAEQVAGIGARATADEDALDDLLASAATRRTHERHRFAAVVTEPQELAAVLGEVEEAPDGVYVGEVDPDDAPETVFVYSGQGSQWAGMAADLYETSPVVRDVLDECDALIRRDVSWSLLDVLRTSDGRLELTDIVQPALLAVQTAVTGWLAESGVRPVAVVGHSVGEIAAAHAAGALSRADAVRLAVRRGLILQETAGRGAMLAVRADRAMAEALIAEAGLPVVVAAVNGPGAVVLSGPVKAVESAAAVLEHRGLRCKALAGGYGFHSPVVAECGPRLRQALAELTALTPSVPIVSSVLPDESDVRFDAAYWERNLTDPVLLWPAVDRLLAGGDRAFVEIGPHPTLIRQLADAGRLRERRGPAVATLRRDEPGELSLRKTLAQLHVAGVGVDWTAITGRPGRYRTLPVPSWGGDSYWLPGVDLGDQGSGPATGRTGATGATGATGTAGAASEPVRLSLVDSDGHVVGEVLAHPAGTVAPDDGGARATPTLSPVPAVVPASAAAPKAGAKSDRGLVQRVEAHVAAVLGLPAGQILPRRRGLFDQGLDSLTAVELRDRLSAEFGMELPSTIVFEKPTIEALSAFFADAGARDQAGVSSVASGGAPEESDDAVAIIGMACRLPGADSPEQFWSLLAEGRNAVRDLPSSRRADPIWAEAGAGVPTRGGYLDEIEGFDADFFRVSPREAKALDPQHRLLLEVAWEALQDGGQSAARLEGQAAGVYFGLNTADYQQLLTRDMAEVNHFFGTGTTFAAAVGHLSYFLGLNGPSIAVDTACSSSLTAVHLACQGLRQGDCGIAIVGGANVIVAPTVSVSMSAAGALAPDGRCKTFDAAADGYGRGEGAAALILKPLSAAKRDGDRVYAVIRGTAVNQDGASGGMTVPNASAQVDVIKQAVATAGWAPRDVDYVEAHGTGTPLGDPIEVRALAEALGPGRAADEAVLIGAAKANIGHLEAAAGVTGLLKVVLALHHGELPPHLMSSPSKEIDWDRLPVSVVTELRPWPQRDRPRRAGVSSFGFSGSNAHVVVEQAPEVEPEHETSGAPRRAPYVLMVTAGSEPALRQAAGRLAARLRAAPDELDDIVYTSAYRRTWLGHRLAVTGTDAAAIVATLEAAARGHATPAGRMATVAEGVENTVGFRFGSELPSAEVRARLAELPEYASALSSVVARATELTAALPVDAAYLFCHQVAATRLWATVGLVPDAAVGEGSGRIAAAWAAGVLELDEALRLAAVDGAVDSWDSDADVFVDVLPQDADEIAATAAELFAAGAVPAPAPGSRRPVSLPAYPWQRRRFWYREFADTSGLPDVPWVLSAASATGLRARAAALRDHTAREADLNPQKVGSALAALPGSAEHRAVVLAKESAGFGDGLSALTDGKSTASLIQGTVTDAAKIALVFPGQGAQWPGMATELMAAEPAFADQMRACDQALAEFTDWSLADVIAGAPGAASLDRVDVVQPTLFAMMVSLAELWRSRGVVPSAVVGHSQGEIAAAYIAGALSLRDAARVVALRSAELTRLSGQGGMASIALDSETVGRVLDPFTGRVSIAAINGPSSVVVAGDVAALDELAAICDADGVRFRRVEVDYASHSPHVEQIRERLGHVLAGITPRRSTTPFYSSATGGLLDTAELGPEYWYRSLRERVRFQDAVSALLADGHDLFIETSPHPVLTPAVEETIEQTGSNARALGTLRRNDGGTGRLLTSLAEAYTRGADVDWQPAFAPDTAEATAIPDIAGHELDAWRYRIAWRPVDGLAAGSAAAAPTGPTGPIAPTGLTGTWLILAPDNGPGAAAASDVCAALVARHVDAKLLALDPTCHGREHIADLLRNATATAAAGVLSLLALDERPHQEFPDAPAGTAATLALIQALGDLEADIPMWLATAGAVAVADSDPASPTQAQVWGMGRVAGLESPQRWGGLIDLPGALGAEALEQLCAVLGGALGDEDQVAIRDGAVHVRRLVRDPVTDVPAARSWQPGGSTLITGGTGRLGRRLARWLASRGAGHLILVGRRGPDAPGARELEAELVRAGGAVTFAACDVADRDAMADVLREARVAGRPVRSVIHTAVSPERDPLSTTTTAQLANALHAKVTGAQVLDDLLGPDAEDTVDAFVLYSSVAGVWGAGDHGVFAAADAHLEALATQRRARGLAGTSVAWGVWNPFGEQDDDPELLAMLAGQSQRQGLPLLDPEQALRSLQRVLDQDETSVVVGDVEWDRFASLFTSIRPQPLFDDIPEARAAAGGDGVDGATALGRLLSGVTESEREWAVLDVVRTEAAAVLGYDRASDVDPDRPFTDMGSDSVTAVEFRTRLNAATGMHLPASIAFDYPTATAVAEHLLELVLGELAGPAADTNDGGIGFVADDGEPIAIVGMACRYPGGVESPDELWRLLVEGRDAIGGLPENREWDLAELFDADPDRSGTAYVREGGFLEDIADFDAQFFAISPREALAMDPRQRLLLETCWELFENAGIAAPSLKGSRTGVYIGGNPTDYASAAIQVPDWAEGYAATGTTGSVMSGRLSYVFGLEGPALTLDAACSSSLVALHLASQALRSGECTMAVAGGAAVMASPKELTEFSRLGALAPDGRCKAFADAADGMALAEGVGLFLVERLSDARRNGHYVHAVIRGSAVNQDGASNGLTAPNGPSQRRVIQAALARAGVTASEVDVVEAHGTGTSLGDPIEAQALLETYGQGRDANRPVLLGSIKSNIGHTQAAAGAAGVMKLVLSMQHGLVPATLHVDAPSAHVDWSSGAVRLAVEQQQWPETGRPRRAGVSAFGMSGTNTHIILEQAPALEEMPVREPEAPTAPIPWPISAATSESLRRQAVKLRRLVADETADSAASPRDIGWSLASSRAALQHRAVVLGADRDDYDSLLTALADGEPDAALVSGTARNKPRIAFVFPGQGSQWSGMAAELLDASPEFAESIRECEQALAPYTDWSLTDVLRRVDGAPGFERVDVVQPALFAVMVSLARLWQHYGVSPAAVVGHSQGEIAAAHVAGALSLEDAAKIVALRAQAITRLTGSAGMASLHADEQQVTTLLTPWRERVTIATVNSPTQVVVAGDTAALDELTDECERRGIRIRRIEVSYASHSPQVEPMHEDLLKQLADITPQRSRIPFYSAVTGEPIDTTGLDAEYWFRNLREPVLFTHATRKLLDNGFTTFIEASPHSVLTSAVTETAMAVEGLAEPLTVGSLRRDDGGLARFVASLAQAWVNGVDLDWAKLIPGGEQVPLPTYAFDRQRFWRGQAPTAADPAALGVQASTHPLLGAAVELADSDSLVLTGRLSAGTRPWLADHGVTGARLLPATGFAELALRAGSQARHPRVEELTLEAPLFLSDAEAVSIQLIVGPPSDPGRRPLAVYTRPEAGDGEPGGWTRHASAVLTTDSLPAPARTSEWPPAGAEPVLQDPDAFYTKAETEGGYVYGPSFRGLRQAWQHGNDVYAEVSLPAGVRDEADRYGVHPALLDAAFQAMMLAPAMGQAEGAGAGKMVRLPFSLTGVSLFAPGARDLRARISPIGPDTVSITATDENGDPVLVIERLVSRQVPAEQLALAAAPADRSLFELEWIAPPARPTGQVATDWVLLGAGLYGNGLIGAGVHGADLLGADPFGLIAGLAEAGISPQSYPDLSALLAESQPCPSIVVLPVSSAADAALPGSAFATTAGVLRDVQAWLADDRTADSRLVVVTGDAVATAPGDGAPDLTTAPVWGLLRSAQTENPGRIVLADLDGPDAVVPLVQALAGDEPQLAIRRGVALIPRLAPLATSRHALTAPPGGRWRLEPDPSGVLDAMALKPFPASPEPLASGQVRVRMRAVGIGFRDVMVALGMAPGGGDFIGGEGAGVVQAVGPDVIGMKPGDPVLGMIPAAFATEAVTDYRWLAPMPESWSFEQAAAIPSAFLTAYYALVETAVLSAGQRVLIHAGTGGVGMAAIQIARHLGAEVFATTSPAKQDVLRELGLDDDHIASSRDAAFADQMLEATDGAGVDVVLNSLVGELVDASLRLLPKGGRFIELGKTDVRSPEEVAQDYPGVLYEQIDLVRDTTPAVMRSLLDDVVPLLEQGTLTELPTRDWDIREAPEAFRYMAQARHVGKLVLTIPPTPDPAGTVLITGGTGTLGGLVAKHLAGPWGMRNIVLASRRGAEAEGVGELTAELTELGADVRVAACDVADRAAVAGLLADIPAEHPLTAVVHLAGVLDDVVFTALTEDRLARVLRPKVDAAAHLHELTDDLPLGMFVTFSSAAGVIGNPGQANYSAANVFLDSLAAARRARGQAGTSVAWGLWAPDSGMTGKLDEQDRERLARAGAQSMSVPEALAMLDEAIESGLPMVVGAHIDRGALRAQAEAGTLPAVLSRLVPRGGARQSAETRSDQSAGGLTELLAGLAPAERRQALVNLVRKHAAAVLGHGSVAAVDAERGFLDVGFDSLTAVELRNRLAAATGLRLPATLIFDCPTPTALAQRLGELSGPADEVPDAADDGGEDQQDREDEIDAVDDMDLGELIRAVHSTEE